jgi:hypothetical protein
LIRRGIGLPNKLSRLCFYPSVALDCDGRKRIDYRARAADARVVDAAAPDADIVAASIGHAVDWILDALTAETPDWPGTRPLALRR